MKTKPLNYYWFIVYQLSLYMIFKLKISPLGSVY